MLSYEYRRIVHWGECDAARIIFFANYFRWIDEGYGLMMRSAGVNIMRQLGPEAIQSTPAISINTRFWAPARLGDEIRHAIEVAEIRNRSFTMIHRFHRDDILLAEAQDSRVWTQISMREPIDMKAVELPAEVVAILKS